MYEDFMKLAQESLKPVMQLAQNNTALAVKLMQAQSENTAQLMQDNLAHVQSLVATKDLNVAVEMQQKYVGRECCLTVVTCDREKIHPGDLEPHRKSRAVLIPERCGECTF